MKEVLADIEELEKNFNMKFTEKLKEFYIGNNGKKVELYTFIINGFSYEISSIYKLNGKFSCKTIKENDLQDDFIDKKLFPFGSDRGGNTIYWDVENKKVYFIAADDVENPCLISESIDEFIKNLQFKK